MDKKLRQYIDEATKNIRDDRALASKLLTDLITSMGGQSDHQSVGLVAAKYLETLQRSNEQLPQSSTVIVARKQRSRLNLRTRFMTLSREAINQVKSRVDYNEE